EITTYLTVVKEGLSVLLVDKERFPEPQMIADALRNEPRIRLYTLWLRGKQPVGAAQEDLLGFKKQHYDVIILGDITANRLQEAQANGINEIEALVAKGTGLMMMGGYDSFGSTWQPTLMNKLLPVKLEGVAGQLDRPVKMLPTDEGKDHFLLRLNQNPGD